ncbi:MAG: cation transporter [Bifidobacteriaceae bacterium]|jgi:copper chaperone CopZ|nr:cation transporter [Bifidobacteriaceae bacterium]
MTTTALKVDGMTCQHCVKAVQEELGQLPGVTSVEVALVPEKTSTVTVVSAGPLDQAAVAAAVAEAGYELATA